MRLFSKEAIIKLIFFISRKLVARYQKEFLTGNEKWYDNTINYLNFFSHPQGLERASIAVFNTDFGSSCLDIGCGDGFVSNLIAPKAASVFAFDVNNDAISVARNRYQKPGLSFHVLSIKELDQISVKSFDSIFCFSVIEFFDDKEIEELFLYVKKTLSKGGKFIGSLNLSSSEDLGYIKSVFPTIDSIRSLLQIYFSSFRIETTQWDKNRTEVYFFVEH